jgi:hypothetical protein
MRKKKEITLSEHLKKIQSKGGKARWADLTPEERSELARKTVQARWAKAKVAKQAPKATPKTPPAGS